jgi:hypothetical protein
MRHWHQEEGSTSGVPSEGPIDQRVGVPPGQAARGRVLKSSGGLAGESPAGVMAKQPRSGWPAAGETAPSKRHDKVLLEGEQVVGPYDEESCRVESLPLHQQGTSGSRARASGGEGHGRRRELGRAALKDPPAYGERNDYTAHHGTGEIRLGTGTMAVGCPPAVPGKGEAYKRRPREVAERRAEVGGGHTVAGRARTTEPAGAKGLQPGVHPGGEGCECSRSGSVLAPPRGTRPMNRGRCWGRTPTRWRRGMWPTDCPGASRVRENLTHGSGRGCWKRSGRPWRRVEPLRRKRQEQAAGPTG